ncbi:MAG: Gfo/Idh/MocA family protein, partial [Acidimicrobiales bacterium]
MKIGLLGTGFGVAHAQIYHRHPQVDDVVVFGRTPAKLDKIAGELGFATTTDLDRIYDDPYIDLVDVCLPTPLHADHVIRALQVGKHVLCELPLASTLADAQRVVDTHRANDRQVFVDMFGRFDPVSEFWLRAITEQPYGALKTLQVDTRTALLWEGYNLGLDSIALDVMHASLDTIVTALGRPESTTAIGVSKDIGGSAAEVLLTYPDMIVHCSASALMPKPYGVRGDWRAAFTDAVVESTWTAGYNGRPTTTLTEFTDHGARDIDLTAVDAYTAVIDHVIACCEGRADSRLDPATVLDSLKVTLDIRDALIRQ